MHTIPPQRILIATDAWHPQVNGVVRTMEKTMNVLVAAGHTVEIVEPGPFRGFSCPVYPEIRLSFPGYGRLAQILDRFKPDRVHISTEGPLGLYLRQVCKQRNYRYTTSYHTKFPEYLHHLMWVPTNLGYRYMRWFHRRSAGLMVATPSLENELRKHKFNIPLLRWSRGVDLKLFRPRPKTLFDLPRPIMLSVGRVSREKSVEDFLRAKGLPGTKVVVGDGPIKSRLEREFPEAKFLGFRGGEELSEIYANSDVFVFPSRTDTFGLVQVEALACGVPVAAYPVVGPIDIIQNEKVGALDNDIGVAIRKALANADSGECVRVAHQYTWENCTRQFLHNTVPIRS